MSEKNMIKRIAFYLFYDPQGIVDDYIPHKLKCLQEFVHDIVFVCNGSLTVESRKKIEALGIQVFCRENKGFDVYGYKEGMELIGYEKIAENYDELILLNYTFFAPIFPFSELFEEMDLRDCDFWGISEHQKLDPNPFTGSGILPRHIQSHFIAVKKRLMKSIEFRKYWEEMPEINSYVESVLKHESRFTQHFNLMGFTSSVYVSCDDYPSPYPTFIDINKTLNNRSPIFKRRIFFQDPLFLDAHNIDIRESLAILKNKSDYNSQLIHKNINRTTKPRDLYTNTDGLKIFSTTQSCEVQEGKKLAVILHLYFGDMWDEIYDYLKNIPIKFDLFISVPTENDKLNLIRKINDLDITTEIRVVEENRGRDMSSLFITFNDIGSSSDYDLICRLHSKKSKQNGVNSAEYFKDYMLQNTLGSKEYVTQIINYFHNNLNIGLMCPPLIHIGFPTPGHSWFSNKPGVEDLCKKLNINTPLDDDTPFATNGTMFWYRPEALKNLFNYKFKFEDFNKEPFHVDGGLAHILERTICYSVSDAGFSNVAVMTNEQAEKSHCKLEFKLQKLASLLPARLAHEQYGILSNYLNNLNTDISNYGVHQSLFLFIQSLKKYFRKNFPIFSIFLFPIYFMAKKIYKSIFNK